MELCRGPSVSIKTHTAPKNPEEKVKRPEEFQKIVENKGRSYAGEKKKVKKEYGQQKASYVERSPKK